MAEVDNYMLSLPMVSSIHYMDIHFGSKCVYIVNHFNLGYTLNDFLVSRAQLIHKVC